MTMSDNRLTMACNPAGEPIAECELAAADTGLLPELEREAARHGAVALWVHCDADLSPAGYTARPGYRRFTGSGVAPGDLLPLLDSPTVLDVLPRAFHGQWGHHQVDAAWVSSPDARYAGLGEPGTWTGLCRFEPGRRLIDGPGFCGWSGSPRAVRTLVRGAVAHLGPGPVTVETWGDPPEAYLDLGLEIASECGGWERLLTR
jgi:hypothetical protein